MPTQFSNRSNGFRDEFRSIMLHVWQVWKYISPSHRVSLLTAMLVMVAGAWCNAQIPVVLGGLATAMEVAKKAGDAWGLESSAGYLGWLIAYFVVREALQVLRKYLVHATTTRVEKDATDELVSHLIELDLATLSREKVGAINGRIHRSVEGLERLLRLLFMDFVPAIMTAAFALGVAIHRQLAIGLLMAGVVPIAAVIVVRQIVSQKGIRLSLLRAKEAVDAAVCEQLGSIEYVRAANTNAYETARVGAVTEQVRGQEIRHHVAMSLFDCAKALNEGVFFILVVAVSITFAAQGKIGIGEIITNAMLFSSVLLPLREVHRIIDEAHESTLRVNDLMAMTSAAVDRSFQVENPREPQLKTGMPAIEMHNLVLDYQTADGKVKTALDGVSLVIRHGETVGFAGRTASGKSTCVRVMLRLSHPSAGEALVGGVPIELVSREAIGRLFGYVSQIPFVFAGTVEENIRYGSNRTAANEIERGAEMACIHSEIMAMSGGYRAQIEERGQNLAGGQRQRLALARTFAKQPSPSILIFDEATSSLDNISERSVHQAITAIKGDRTAIIVAHRLSTLRHVDRIFVFDKGRVVEVGTYEELANRGGVFTELVRSAGEGNGQANMQAQ